MEQRYWKNEFYNIIYEDEKMMLVQNNATKTYSFGMSRDFGSLYGFPVMQSCLTKKQCISLLKSFIEIADKYHDVSKTKQIYEAMIVSLEGQNE